jgi:hypothetical protein
MKMMFGFAGFGCAATLLGVKASESARPGTSIQQSGQTGVLCCLAPGVLEESIATRKVFFPFRFGGKPSGRGGVPSMRDLMAMG